MRCGGEKQCEVCMHAVCGGVMVVCQWLQTRDASEVVAGANHTVSLFFALDERSRCVSIVVVVVGDRVVGDCGVA